MNHIEKGTFDNVITCKYDVPDYWIIGDVYGRLIEDLADDNMIDTLILIYKSWINDAISNYNSDFYYQPRDYIAECFRQNEIL